MKVLNSKEFGVDYSKAEFKTFTIADSSGYYTCEFDYLSKNFPMYINRVFKAIEAGKSYISINEPQDIGTSYFEIQWD